MPSSTSCQFPQEIQLYWWHCDFCSLRRCVRSWECRSYDTLTWLPSPDHHPASKASLWLRKLPTHDKWPSPAAFIVRTLHHWPPIHILVYNNTQYKNRVGPTTIFEHLLCAKSQIKSLLTLSHWTLQLYEAGLSHTRKEKHREVKRYTQSNPNFKRQMISPQSVTS